MNSVCEDLTFQLRTSIGAGCIVEAYPSNHIDAYQMLIELEITLNSFLLDKAYYFRSGEML
jgi:hypothetical protein